MKFNEDNFSFEELNIGDLVDEDVVMDLMDMMPPATFRSSCMQVGEPYDHRYDENTDKCRPTYSTFKKVDETTYEYCGNCFKGETEERGKQPQYVSLKEDYNEIESKNLQSGKYYFDPEEKSYFRVNDLVEKNKEYSTYNCTYEISPGKLETGELMFDTDSVFIESDPSEVSWSSSMDDIETGKRNYSKDSFDYKGVHVYFDTDQNRWVDSDGRKYMSYLTDDDIKYYIDMDDSLDESKDTSYYDGPFIPVRNRADMILQLVEEELVDPSDLCLQLVKYMNEDDLKDFMEIYDYDEYFDKSGNMKNDYSKDESLTEAKKNPAYNNIRKVAKAMNWNMPMFVDPSAYGYLTWKKITNDQVEEIKKKTGLDVKLARSGRLIVPRSDDKEVEENLKKDRSLRENYQDYRGWDFINQTCLETIDSGWYETEDEFVDDQMEFFKDYKGVLEEDGVNFNEIPKYLHNYWKNYYKDEDEIEESFRNMFNIE